MRILVVSDSSAKNEMGQSLEEEIMNRFRQESYDYKHYNVSETEIKKCVGCFNCWTTTPGLCIFDDITREICKESVNSDLYILLSEIKYGCYSAEIKRVLDRSIGNILPFFKKINGEMHHAPRYDKYPQLCVIGYGSYITTKEEETFRDICQANAINFQIEKANTYVCKSIDETEMVINNLVNCLKKKGSER